MIVDTTTKGAINQSIGFFINLWLKAVEYRPRIDAGNMGRAVVWVWTESFNNAL